MAKRPLSHWLLFALLVLFWGSAFALTKIAVASISPAWVVALRLCLAAVLLWAAAAARGRRLPRDLRAWAWFAWMAFSGSFAPFLLIAWGTQHIDSSLAGILSAAVPIMVGALAHFMLPDEPMNRFAAGGLAVGFAGVVLLIGPASLLSLSGSGLQLVAELAVLGATFCFAIQTVTARKMPPMGVGVRAAGSLIVSAVFGLVFALVTDPGGIAYATATPASLAAAVWLGLFPTGVAALVLFRLLDQAGARFLAFSNYLTPAVAVFMGVTLLGERPGWSALAGLGLILAGIAVAERGRDRRLRTGREDG